eukprot:scaffold17221_cov73-Skeletonema_dohrnii-CCMP3373.AAC.2
MRAITAVAKEHVAQVYTDVRPNAIALWRDTRPTVLLGQSRLCYSSSCTSSCHRCYKKYTEGVGSRTYAKEMKQSVKDDG